MNRRSILSLFAAAPLAGKAVAEQAVESLGNYATPPYEPPPPNSPVDATTGQRQLTPRMDSRAAMRLIVNDAKALAEIRAELAEAELRSNPYIDPDIQIMRSWSPMAKVTFQRQRNVERALADALENRHEPNRYIRAIEARIKNLMWGI